MHFEFLSLFYNIRSNQATTIFKIVQYLLQMSGDNSTTWSAHLRNLCIRYHLPNPLQLLLSGETWVKSRWSTLTKTMITIYFEKKLRREAETNSKMTFLNVQVQGLSGIPHPALLSISNVQEVRKLRHHLKFLSGDFLTAERLAIDNGTSPQCKLCLAPVENTAHVLTKCRATSDIHSRMLPELLNTVLQVQANCALIQSTGHSHFLTQFILDCTSLNLPASHRIAAHNPGAGKVFAVARNWCYAISRERARLLQKLKSNGPQL